jgi:hypothetical protein
VSSLAEPVSTMDKEEGGYPLQNTGDRLNDSTALRSWPYVLGGLVVYKAMHVSVNGES